MCQTVLYNAPLIFLREAETAQGQNDLVLTPNPYLQQYTLNYSAMAALAGAAGDQVTSPIGACTAGSRCVARADSVVVGC